LKSSRRIKGEGENTTHASACLVTSTQEGENGQHSGDKHTRKERSSKGRQYRIAGPQAANVDTHLENLSCNVVIVGGGSAQKLLTEGRLALENLTCVLLLLEAALDNCWLISSWRWRILLDMLLLLEAAPDDC